MSDIYSRHVKRTVPQSEQADRLQVANSAGGFSFKVTPMTKLERFLILGTEGGTYYIEEKDLTKGNFENLSYVTKEFPKETIDKIDEISYDNRSYKNNAAIFVLAYVLTFALPEWKAYARTKVNRVVRTGTHLKLFNSYLDALAPGSGLGTSRNKALANWYESKDSDQIAYQVVKYRQRHGYDDRRILRRARPKEIHSKLAEWILGKFETFDPSKKTGILPEIVYAFERVQAAKTIKDLLTVMSEYPQLPWEAVPTQFHKNIELWKKLFYNNSLNGQALVRNITRIARLGGFNDLVFAKDYADKLKNAEMVNRTRLHPIAFLNALTVHTEGQVDRHTGLNYAWSTHKRNKDWITSPVIIDALNEGYHQAFANVVPSNKRILLAVDVSGSMSSAMALGLDLTAAQVAAAMATTIARTEPYHQIMGFADRFRDLGITARMDLNTVMSRTSMMSFGGTDCSLPMVWAQQNKLEFDTFVVITDAETWAGSTHPHIALQNYRQFSGISARSIVVATSANDFTIADPNDAGMLDVAGADANLTKLVSEFSAGRV